MLGIVGRFFFKESQISETPILDVPSQTMGEIDPRDPGFQSYQLKHIDIFSIPNPVHQIPSISSIYFEALIV